MARAFFESGELSRDSVVAFSATTAADGKSHKVAYYNLDMIYALSFDYDPRSEMTRRFSATVQMIGCRMIGCRLKIERLRRTYESSQSLEKREGYNQPNENLTSDEMKILQVTK